MSIIFVPSLFLNELGFNTLLKQMRISCLSQWFLKVSFHILNVWTQLLMSTMYFFMISVMATVLLV